MKVKEEELIELQAEVMLISKKLKRVREHSRKTLKKVSDLLQKALHFFDIPNYKVDAPRINPTLQLGSAKTDRLGSKTTLKEALSLVYVYIGDFDYDGAIKYLRRLFQNIQDIANGVYLPYFQKGLNEAIDLIQEQAELYDELHKSVKKLSERMEDIVKLYFEARDTLKSAEIALAQAKELGVQTDKPVWGTKSRKR